MLDSCLAGHLSLYAEAVEQLDKVAQCLKQVENIANCYKAMFVWSASHTSKVLKAALEAQRKGSLSLDLVITAASVSFDCSVARP
jgi:hypothetical protein